MHFFLERAAAFDHLADRKASGRSGYCFTGCGRGKGCTQVSGLSPSLAARSKRPRIDQGEKPRAHPEHAAPVHLGRVIVYATEQGWWSAQPPIFSADRVMAMTFVRHIILGACALLLLLAVEGLSPPSARAALDKAQPGVIPAGRNVIMI